MVEPVYNMLQVQIAGTPGPVYRSLLKASARFLVIIFFLAFVFIVVMSFGSVYRISSTNQMLATLAGGFIPFIFSSLLKPVSADVETNLVSFKSKLEEIVKVCPLFYAKHRITTGPVRRRSSQSERLEYFHVRIINFARISILTYCIPPHRIMTSLTTSGRSYHEKTGKNATSNGFGIIFRERLKRGSRNFTHLSGTIGLKNLLDMTALATSGWKLSVFEIRPKMPPPTALVARCFSFSLPSQLVGFLFSFNAACLASVQQVGKCRGQRNEQLQENSMQHYCYKPPTVACHNSSHRTTARITSTIFNSRPLGSCSAPSLQV